MILVLIIVVRICASIVMQIMMKKSVRLNRINHNPKSAFLIGDDMPNDKVHKAVQKSWINGQISLNEFLI